MYGKLYLCATPIGNLSDISKRLAETLEAVDLIAAEDTRHTLKLLNNIGVSKPMTSYFEHNKAEKGEFLLEELKRGKNIALVSDAGTPAVSDPGEDLVALCAANGIGIVPIPGPTAAICALIVSGLPTSRFAFEGFLSVNRKNRFERLSKIKEDDRTLVFYEAPHKLLNTLADMLNILGDRKIALCRELTKLHEEVRRCTLKEALDFYTENAPRGEFVLVISGADRTDKSSGYEDLTVAEHVALYINQGFTEKEAIKKTADDRGVPKREVYAETKIGNKKK